ncbi:MAG: EI24 domain-containing protein [Betaproteobacteria bacterium]|nr:EI24 domain-containing protein [Betaproteobacteria bacterium]
MRNIFVALGRSVRSLARLDVFGHLIWPGIVSALLWIIVAVFSWAVMVDSIMESIQGMGWVGDRISASVWMAGAMLILVKLLVALAFVPLFYVTTMVLVATVALPMMLDRVARRDYADLEQRHGGSSMGSIGNTLAALLWFVLIMAASLPLWLIPGVALVAPVLATGWLSQRVFGYDALMLHADRDEFMRLRQESRPQMLLLGGGITLLAYVPVVNIVAPSLSGLAFVHFLLEALRRERHERGVSVLDPERIES